MLKRLLFRLVTRFLPVAFVATLIVLMPSAGLAQTLVPNTGASLETNATVGKPIGYFDGIGGTGTDKYAWCWAVDPGEPSAALEIGMSLDGKPVGFIQPNVLRDDVIAAYGGGQVKHGCAMGFAPKYYAPFSETYTVGLYAARFGEWHELTNSPRVVRLGTYGEPVVTVYIGKKTTGKPLGEFVSASLWEADSDGFFQEVSWSDFQLDNAWIRDGKLIFRKDMSEQGSAKKIGPGTYRLQVWSNQNYRGGWSEIFEVGAGDVFLPPIFLSRWVPVEFQSLAVNGKAKFTVTANPEVKADVIATFYSNTPTGYYETIAKSTVELKQEGNVFDIPLPREAVGFGVCGQFLLTEAGKPGNLLGYTSGCTPNPLLKIQ